MKRTLAFLVILMISGVAFVNGADFSGNWKLNATKSKLNDQFSMAPKEVILGQQDNELNVEKHASFQDQEITIKDKFTLDGKECINSGWQDSQKKSTAVWAGDKSSLTITSKLAIGSGGEEMTIVEVYKLDGSNLVIETKASSSYGEVAETQVFDKQ